MPNNTVDGRYPAPVEVGSSSHDSQGFIHPRRLFGMSSINSMNFLEAHRCKTCQAPGSVEPRAFGIEEIQNPQNWTWERKFKIQTRLKTGIGLESLQYQEFTGTISGDFAT